MCIGEHQNSAQAVTVVLPMCHREFGPATEYGRLLLSPEGDLSRTVFYGLKAFQTSWATTDMRSRKPGGGSPKIKGTMFCVCSDKCEQVCVPVSFVACLTN